MSNTQMSLSDFHARHLKLGEKDVILDVRNPDEFKEARIAGAINIPLPELTQNLDKLKNYEHIYIHCKRGGRAKMAYEALQQAGLHNLVCIYDAGMDAWIEAGHPHERG